MNETKFNREFKKWRKRRDVIEEKQHDRAHNLTIKREAKRSATKSNDSDTVKPKLGSRPKTVDAQNYQIEIQNTKIGLIILSLKERLM